MSKQNDGGPAFPSQPLTPQGEPADALSPGMSLRDWFAGMVLSGMGIPYDYSKGKCDGAAAFRAYALADAMLEARDK